MQRRFLLWNRFRSWDHSGALQGVIAALVAIDVMAGRLHALARREAAAEVQQRDAADDAGAHDRDMCSGELSKLCSAAQRAIASECVCVAASGPHMHVLCWSCGCPAGTRREEALGLVSQGSGRRAPVVVTPIGGQTGSGGVLAVRSYVHPRPALAGQRLRSRGPAARCLSRSPCTAT